MYMSTFTYTRERTNERTLKYTYSFMHTNITRTRRRQHIFENLLYKTDIERTFRKSLHEKIAAFTHIVTSERAAPTN